MPFLENLDEMCRLLHKFSIISMGNSARDRAVIEALESLEDGILDKEKRDANVKLLSERLAAKVE